MLLFLCVFGTQAQEQAQKQPKFHLILDYRYMLGLSDRGDIGVFSRKDLDMDGHSLRLSGVYSFFPQLAAGIGIGADRYPPNTLPVFATVHYNPCKSNPFYLFGNAGYAFKTGTAVSGLLVDAGLGYKLMFKKHFGLNFHFGYNLKQFNMDIYNYVLEDDDLYYEKITSGTQTRHSLSFGVGLIF
jgi:hypothetical protein